MVGNLEVIAIVTSGGKGQRLPGKVKKQYLEFNGTPLIAQTISIFVAFDPVDLIVVTVPEEDIPMVNDMIKRIFQKNASIIKVIAGGKTRQESVHNALSICPSDTGYVMIHDAVRPFVMVEVLYDLLRKVKKYKAVIPVTEVKNTIKEVSKTKVIRTLDRSRLVQVNTPQVFVYNLVKTAYNRALADKLSFTDDAAVVEHYGHPVYCVWDSEMNLKLTTEVDKMFMHILFSVMEDEPEEQRDDNGLEM